MIKTWFTRKPLQSDVAILKAYMAAIASQSIEFDILRNAQELS